MFSSTSSSFSMSHDDVLDFFKVNYEQYGQNSEFNIAAQHFCLGMIYQLPIDNRPYNLPRLNFQPYQAYLSSHADLFNPLDAMHVINQLCEHALDEKTSFFRWLLFAVALPLLMNSLNDIAWNYVFKKIPWNLLFDLHRDEIQQLKNIAHTSLFKYLSIASHRSAFARFLQIINTFDASYQDAAQYFLGENLREKFIFYSAVITAIYQRRLFSYDEKESKKLAKEIRKLLHDSTLIENIFCSEFFMYALSQTSDKSLFVDTKLVFSLLTQAMKITQNKALLLKAFTDAYVCHQKKHSAPCFNFDKFHPTACAQFFAMLDESKVKSFQYTEYFFKIEDPVIFYLVQMIELASAYLWYRSESSLTALSEYIFNFVNDDIAVALKELVMANALLYFNLKTFFYPSCGNSIAFMGIIAVINSALHRFKNLSHDAHVPQPQQQSSTIAFSKPSIAWCRYYAPGINPLNTVQRKSLLR